VYLSGLHRKLNYLIYGILLLIYCIPSIALFSLLIPLFGLGKTTALIGLVGYNQIILLRSFKTAFAAIPGPIIEVSESMGMSKIDRFRLVYLPIMLPYLLSGLRVATVSTTGIATMAALINAGGLGNLLFEGMRTYHMPKLIWGIILISSLALCFNYIFAFFENKAVKHAAGGKTFEKQ
jgi:osmoprotectant transport system permease protein